MTEWGWLNRCGDRIKWLAGSFGGKLIGFSGAFWWIAWTSQAPYKQAYYADGAPKTASLLAQKTIPQMPPKSALGGGKLGENCFFVKITPGSLQHTSWLHKEGIWYMGCVLEIDSGLWQTFFLVVCGSLSGSHFVSHLSNLLDTEKLRAKMVISHSYI